MSLNASEKINCPKCGQMHTITVWDSITANDSTDLKNDILTRRINMFECSSCDHVALFPNPLLYTDTEKKLIISFIPTYDKNEKMKLFDEIKKTSKESGELKAFEHYNLRFVSDYNDLIEKILIFDAGLNDKTVEFLKMLILSQDPQTADDRVCMFGKITDDSIEFLIQDIKNNQMYTSNVPLETYNTVNIELKNTGIKPYSFDWEMIDLDYIARVVNGLNNTF